MRTKNWKILLVDDEKEFITTLAERLELRGIATQVCHDGHSALAAIRENPPQVAVLDVMMPGLKGTEVLQQLKKEFPAVQVILLTGQTSLAEPCDSTLAFACLTKPLKLEDFMRTLTDAIEAAKGEKNE